LLDDTAVKELEMSLAENPYTYDTHVKVEFLVIFFIPATFLLFRVSVPLPLLPSKRLSISSRMRAADISFEKSWASREGPCCERGHELAVPADARHVERMGTGRSSSGIKVRLFKVSCWNTLIPLYE
jgi:hypothetical protein